jgi:hypothetical protein
MRFLWAGVVSKESRPLILPRIYHILISYDRVSLSVNSEFQLYFSGRVLTLDKVINIYVYYDQYISDEIRHKRYISN